MLCTSGLFACSLGAVLVCGLVGASSARAFSPPPQKQIPAVLKEEYSHPNSPFDPKALQLLEETTQAYAQRDWLQEKTDFTAYSWIVVPGPSVSEEIPENLKPQPVSRTLTLRMLRPNLFFMELHTVGADKKEETDIWDCDGRTFWTYTSEKNYYTKAPAPPELEGLARLPGMNMSAPEVMMLLNQNPFAHVTERFDGARLLPPFHLEGKPPLLGVELWMAGETTKNLLRLYIDPKTYLIYRVVFETIPTPTPTDPALVGDDVDALAARRPITPTDSSGMAFALVCDNSFADAPKKEQFLFTPPKGALFFQPLDNPQDLLDYLQHNMQRTDLRHMLRGRKLRVVRP